MSCFVLVHGAWHGGWSWDGLAGELRAAGHQVRAIDLPGMGSDPTPLPAVTLAGWIQRVVTELQSLPEPAQLVGHSMGGMVITGAAAAVPARVACATYVCAFLPQDGESLLSLAMRPEGAATALVQEPTADGVSTTVAPASARAAFYGLCAPADAEAAIARLTPQPLQPILAPIALGSHAPVARRYLECTEDRAIPLALQRFMAARSPGIRIDTLPSDHSPFLSMPGELLNLLQNQL